MDSDRSRSSKIQPRDDLTIKMHPRKDKYGHTYYIVRPDAPVLLNLQECTIFIFTHDKPEISIRGREAFFKKNVKEDEL